MVKKSQAELDRMYNNLEEALTILYENKDYFSEKDFNNYKEKLICQIDDVAGQLLEYNKENTARLMRQIGFMMDYNESSK